MAFLLSSFGLFMNIDASYRLRYSFTIQMSKFVIHMFLSCINVIFPLFNLLYSVCVAILSAHKHIIVIIELWPK